MPFLQVHTHTHTQFLFLSLNGSPPSSVDKSKHPSQTFTDLFLFHHLYGVPPPDTLSNASTHARTHWPLAFRLPNGSAPQHYLVGFRLCPFQLLLCVRSDGSRYTTRGLLFFYRTEGIRLRFWDRVKRTQCTTSLRECNRSRGHTHAEDTSEPELFLSGRGEKLDFSCLPDRLIAQSVSFSWLLPSRRLTGCWSRWMGVTCDTSMFQIMPLRLWQQLTELIPSMKRVQFHTFFLIYFMSCDIQCLVNEYIETAKITV